MTIPISLSLVFARFWGTVTVSPKRKDKKPSKLLQNIYPKHCSHLFAHFRSCVMTIAVFAAKTVSIWVTTVASIVETIESIAHIITPPILHP